MGGVEAVLGYGGSPISSTERCRPAPCSGWMPLTPPAFRGDPAALRVRLEVTFTPPGNGAPPPDGTETPGLVRPIPTPSGTPLQFVFEFSVPTP